MIFIDANAFIALTIPTDKFCKKALSWRSLHLNEEFITSNTVYIETLGWIRYKAGKRIAVAAGESLFSGIGLKIERVSIDDEREAWEIFKKTEGRGLSMVDCITIVLMKRLKIKEIFTFDRDFLQFGFKVYPA